MAPAIKLTPPPHSRLIKREDRRLRRARNAVHIPP